MKRKNLFLILPFLVITGAVASGIVYFARGHADADMVLKITLAVGTLPLLARIVYSLLRGHLGIDLIAILAIGGAWLLDQYLAGIIILLMLSGGEALEEYAKGRARRELDKLLALAPKIAHRKEANGEVSDLPVEQIAVSDIIIAKPGEIVPVDGMVVSGESEVDEAALTGESLPVIKAPGSAVMSGSVNRDRVLEIRAMHAAADSKYQQIIALVREAEGKRAPIVRLADRYSLWFTALTFGIAGAAWLFSHDPIRALAVLVVATPCPLILATPIAVISGMSKAAARGIIIKNGSALEMLGQIRSFIFDKTGTLTLGKPEVTQVDGDDGFSAAEALRIAASLDQLSTHVLARSLIDYAHGRKVDLHYPENFQEFFGDGVSGEVDGKEYFLGRLSFLEKNGIKVSPRIAEEHRGYQAKGVITVYLATRHKLIGDIHFADVVRPESGRLFATLRGQGIKRIVMLTGDHRDVAAEIAGKIGITEFEGELLPEDKVDRVKALKLQSPPLAMVGDGINDAPALATADVGIALGGAGNTASSESGDVVIMVDDLSRVGEAFAISRYTLYIAKQSIFAGIGLSVGLMLLAAAGFISPVVGALLQEVIDVLVIFNALRVNRWKPTASTLK